MAGIPQSVNRRRCPRFRHFASVQPAQLLHAKRGAVLAATVTAALVVAILPVGAGGATAGPSRAQATAKLDPHSRSSGHPALAAKGHSAFVSGLLSTQNSVATQGAQISDNGIYDQKGRFVLLHGVNAVYKRPPYVLYPAPGKPWNFDASDARSIHALGFNTVRLGILWQGIEPGTLGPNNPRVCTHGTPGDPGQWNQAVANRYIQHLKTTVDLLGRYHIYSLIDMHQDVYSQVFRGEGFPKWAVCTDGLPLKALPGRWSNNYGNKSLDNAFDNFWKNDVVGNLQGEYDRSWAAVAAAFKDDPWVLGYDPINEPFTTGLESKNSTAVQLECFYTGSQNPGYAHSPSSLVYFGPRLDCGRDVPALGVVPSIQAVDPTHMIFIEPTIYEYHGKANYIGPMPYNNLVLNFHAYCGARSPVTGNPYNNLCFTEVERRFIAHKVAATNLQAQGPGLPLFLSEFGATQSRVLLGQATSFANSVNLGWAYWSWKYYNDPTGSSKEGLAAPDGRLYQQAPALDQSYPQAVSGTVDIYLYQYINGDLYLSYDTDPTVKGPTLIHISRRERGHGGYCVSSNGAQVISAPNAPTLQIANPTTASHLVVAVTSGKC